MGRRSFNIDLICTVKNEFSNIKSLISDLNKQTEVPNRIVIVDGGSNDGTYELLMDLVKNNNKFLIIQDDCDLDENTNIGPIARGRNIAIKACSSDFILMADAGCRYHENWIRAYKNKININESLYSGGSKLSSNSTDIDLAVAPLLGFDLPSKDYSAKPSGSCRSLCISRSLYNDVGGFREIFKTGEDTDFISRAKRVAKMISVEEGAAIYTPNYNLPDACKKLISYAYGDGMYYQSKKRFLKMSLRVLFQVTSFMLIFTAGYMLLPTIYLVAETFFAYRSGFLILYKKSIRAIFYRYLLSLLTPYLYCGSYVYGLKRALTQ